MTTRTGESLNWPRIVRTKLLPELPGFRVRGRLLYEAPVGEVLHALQIETSGFTKAAVYVECFVLPLYVLHSQVSFDLGLRLRDPATGAARWEVVDGSDIFASMSEAMREQGLHLFREAGSPCGLLPLLGTTFGDVRNPHTLEALAYTQLIADQPGRALATLQKLAGAVDLAVGWEREIHRRASIVSALIAAGDVPSAHGQLAAWRRLSLENLRLA